ncbi:MAG TPA: sugar transferase [Candidatus Angelobacter sp.]|nr:sugar transferase [Candidatus Angelobacter sp.]
MNTPAYAKDAALESATEPRIHGAAAVVKRALDIAVSAVLLILLSPVLLLLSVLIRLHDGGPALYRRRVVGRDATFDAFKLRTMRADADDILMRDPSLRREFEVNFKLKQDPRVTRLGSIIRKTSIDELPQLWNVLKGEMSLVGPRMISPAELEKYGRSGWIFRVVKPGLTGYWQVHGRQQVTYDQRVEMDLFYARNWSLLLDLQIMLKTPMRVIRGSGAY